MGRRKPHKEEPGCFVMAGLLGGWGGALLVLLLYLATDDVYRGAYWVSGELLFGFTVGAIAGFAAALLLLCWG